MSAWSLELLVELLVELLTELLVESPEWLGRELQDWSKGDISELD